MLDQLGETAAGALCFDSKRSLHVPMFGRLAAHLLHSRIGEPHVEAVHTGELGDLLPNSVCALDQRLAIEPLGCQFERDQSRAGGGLLRLVSLVRSITIPPSIVLAGHGAVLAGLRLELVEDDRLGLVGPVCGEQVALPLALPFLAVA